MKKQKMSLTTVLLVVLTVLACDAVLLVLFNTTFKSVTGQYLPWWAYVVATCIYALIVYLIYILVQMRKQRFDKLLARQGFKADKSYEADGQKLCIDFDGKRIANTYLATKTFVDFSDIVGCRVECYRNGADKILDENSRYLNLVLTIKRDDPTPDSPYLYLAMFEIEVASADVPQEIDVTEQMVEKYPQLQPLYELKLDVQKILQLNLSAPQSKE